MATVLLVKLVTNNFVPEDISCLSLYIACGKGVSQRISEGNYYKISMVCIIFKVEAFQIAVVPTRRVASHLRTVHIEPKLVIGFGTKCQIGSNDYYHPHQQ